MALVLLPCELPSWPAVERHLDTLATVQTSDELVSIMQQVHGLCCLSLDPDESDRSDAELFRGLREFLDVAMSVQERDNFFGVTLPSLARYARRLKLYKPVDGLSYSLQQQADCSSLDRRFVASLVANAFFSTFPRRTRKTHPTLQDCNFARFFVQLNRQDQQTKLRNVLNYFDRIAGCEPIGKVVLIRKVMSKVAEMDFDDWLQCSKLLCPVKICHNDRTKHMEFGSLKVCFGSNRIGGLVLDGGEKQEDLIFGAFPELFMAILSTELLETNEAFAVHGLFPIGECSGQKSSKDTNDADQHWNTHVCLAESMRFEPEGHLFKESIVRELNKALTAFRQRAESSVRLRPIGKSLSATPPKDLSPIKEDVSPTATTTADVVIKSFIENRSDDFKSKPLDDDAAAADDDDDDDSEQGSVRDSLAFVRDLMARGWPSTNVESSTTMMKRPSGAYVDDVTGRARGMTKSLHRSHVLQKMISRGESEDSFYADCREDAAEDTNKERVRARPRCGGLMFQRPLMLPDSSRSVPRTQSRSIERRQCSAKPSPLDGLISMEASFASCYTHQSSSSSSSPDDGDDDEDGFQSCSEELEDVSSSQNISSTLDSRRETMTESEFPSELEDGAKWGRRLESGPVNCRRMKPSISCCTTDSTDDGSYPAMDTSQEDSVWRPPRRRRLAPRRAASTGFTMEDDEDEIEDGGYDNDDDIFMGDAQLEHERDWLANFRHRSVNPSRCSTSRRDSSRYSFSSDFSSDLEDIYDHFEEKMTEGPVRDDPTIRSRLGDRLKRTLSDSLASFPRVAMAMPRSLSLTERMQQERLNVNVSATAAARVRHPLDFDVSVATGFADSDDDDDEQQRRPTPACHGGHLVGTADVDIEQSTLCAVDDDDGHDDDECIELSLTLPRTLKRLPSQLSVWWNYNSVYDFCVPLCRQPRHALTAGTTVTTDGDAEPHRKLDGWPLRKMASRKFSKNSLDVGAAESLGRDVLRHVITDFNAYRRSKSTTDYEELMRTARISSFRHSVDAVAKSKSLKDVPSTRLLPRAFKMIPEVSFEMEGKQPQQQNQSGLRKWQAALNLNDLAAEDVAASADSSELDKKRSGDDLLFDAGRTFENRSQSRPDRSVTAQQCLPDNIYGNTEDGDICRPIETGNWGFHNGNHKDDIQSSDPQLMALVIWMAASRADVPCVIYHTGGDQRVVKLSIVSRVLLDRRWTVGRIARAILSHYATPLARRKSLTTEQDVDLLQSLLPKETDF